MKLICAAAIAASLLAIGLASCGGDSEGGGGSDGGDREQAASVAADYVAAATSGDGAGACALMTDTNREQTAAKGSCEDSFAASTGSDEGDPEAEVFALTGNRANVVVKQGSSSSTVFLLKEADGWKVAGGVLGSGG